MAVDPIPKSLGALRSTEESVVTTGELGGGEQLVLTMDELATVLGATVETVGSSEAETRATDVAPTFEIEGPAVLEE